MKQMHLILIIFLSFLVSIITACNGNNAKASILIYNNQVFIGKELVSKEEYTEVIKTEKIIKKENSISPPYTNLTANELSEGAEIFIIDESTIIGMLDNGMYRLFERKSMK